MSHYCYRELSATCAPRGAITSNAKYIAPLAPVYSEKYTRMLRYPGSTVNEGRIYVPPTEGNKSHVDHHHAAPIQQKRRGCSGCSTWN